MLIAMHPVGIQARPSADSRWNRVGEAALDNSGREYE
jgi:hypothetical protein